MSDTDDPTPQPKAATGAPQAPPPGAPPGVQPGTQPGMQPGASEVPRTPAPGVPQGVPADLPSARPWAPPPRMPLGAGSVWPERVWAPLRTAAAPARVLAGALAAGAVAAFTLRLDAPGLGYLLTGLAVLAAALGTLPRWPGLDRLAWAVATLALLTIGVVRAADWLFALSLLVATATASLALAGGRGWPALVLGTFSVPLAQARAFIWSGRGMRRLAAAKGSLVFRAVAVGIVTTLLVTVFGGLFYGADGVFARLVDAALPEFSLSNILGNTVLLIIVTGLALSAACVAHVPPTFDEIAPSEPRLLRRWEWATPLGVLNALFAAFCAIQVTVLFGERHTELLGELGFAEYARQGFWQLLAVTVLTLGVLALASAKASRATRTDRVLVRVLLGGLSVFTLIIVGSALARMMSYEDEFGFTRLRLFVHSVELWLGVVFVLVLLAGVRLRGRWLPRAIIGTGVVALLGLAALNPDAYIAQRNRERFTDTGKIDVLYLGGLSADAVPELQRLQEPERSCALRQVSVWGDEVGEEHWYTFNAGRAAARASLAKTPVNDTTNCPLDYRSLQQD